MRRRCAPTARSTRSSLALAALSVVLSAAFEPATPHPGGQTDPQAPTGPAGLVTLDDEPVPAGPRPLLVREDGDELILEFDEMRGTPLGDFLYLLEARLGLALRYAPETIDQTRVRIVGPQRIPRDDLFRYGRAVLRSYGFLLVPCGTGPGAFLEVRKVVAPPRANGCVSPVVAREDLREPDGPVIAQSFLPLEHTDPRLLVDVLGSDPILRFGVEADHYGWPHVYIAGARDRLAMAAEAIEVVDTLNGELVLAEGASPLASSAPRHVTPWIEQPRDARLVRLLGRLIDATGLDQPTSPTCPTSDRSVDRAHLSARIPHPSQVDVRLTSSPSLADADSFRFLHRSGDARRAVEVTLTPDQARLLTRLVELMDRVLVEGPRREGP